MDQPIQHEEIENRGAFFLRRDSDRVASLTYSRMSPTLAIIDHTEVAPGLEGQGLGRALLDAAVEWAREDGTRFKVVCPFARAQFARDPSIRDVLA